VFVGGVVVNHQVDVESGRHIGVDVPQKAQELLVAMAGATLGEDLAY
jgi:hypothetical protein